MGKGSGTCARPSLSLASDEGREPVPAASVGGAEPLRPVPDFAAWRTECGRFMIGRDSTHDEGYWRVRMLLSKDTHDERLALSAAGTFTRRFPTRRLAVRAIGRACSKAGLAPPSGALRRGSTRWTTEDGTINVHRWRAGDPWVTTITGLETLSGDLDYQSFATRRTAVAAARARQAELGISTVEDAEDAEASRGQRTPTAQ